MFVVNALGNLTLDQIKKIYVLYRDLPITTTTVFPTMYDIENHSKYLSEIYPSGSPYILRVFAGEVDWSNIDPSIPYVDVVELYKVEEEPSKYVGPTSFFSFIFNTIVIYNVDDLPISYGTEESPMDLNYIRNFTIDIIISYGDAKISEIKVDIYEEFAQHSAISNIKGQLADYEGHQELFDDSYSAEDEISLLNKKIKNCFKASITDSSNSDFDIEVEYSEPSSVDNRRSNTFKTSEFNKHYKYPEIYFNLEGILTSIGYTPSDWNKELKENTGVSFSSKGIFVYYFNKINDNFICILFHSGAYKQVDVIVTPYEEELDEFLNLEQIYRTKIFDYFNNLVLFTKYSVLGIVREDEITPIGLTSFTNRWVPKHDIPVKYYSGTLVRNLHKEFFPSDEFKNIVPSELFDLTSSYYGFTGQSFIEETIQDLYNQVYEGFDPRIISQNVKYKEGRELLELMKKTIKVQTSRIINDKIQDTNSETWIKIIEGCILYQRSSYIFELLPLTIINDDISIWYEKQDNDYLQISNNSYILQRDGIYYFNQGKGLQLLELDEEKYPDQSQIVLKYSRGVLFEITPNQINYL